MKFLINTITNWYEPPRTRHFVALYLAKKHTVVFVAANHIGMPSLRIDQLIDNLTVITPSFPIDMRIRYRIPILNAIYQNWLFRELSQTYSDFEVINFDYTATRIFRYFRNVVYYCNDSFFEISKHINPFPIAKYHLHCEALVATRSKFCVSIASKITEHLSVYNPHILEVPLGSPDISEYSITVHNVPSKQKIIKVVLVAVIKKLNISYNVINLLLADPDISLTLIGPVQRSFLEQISNKDRLTCKGTVYGKELYEEINAYDVAIAPYCTETRNEIFSGTGGKIYHYLSLGKPVVISYMSGLNQMNLQDRLIYVAEKSTDFPALVHRAYEENTEELIQQRIDYARRNTWDKRMEDLTAYYELVNSKSNNGR
jgi:hypothetical protein